MAKKGYCKPRAVGWHPINFMSWIMFFSAALLITVSSLADEATDLVKSGVEKAQKGDFNGAKADFDAAIQSNPNYAVAYNERGLVDGALAKQGGNMDSLVASAFVDYSKAIELNPDYADAYYNRGNIFQAIGSWESARTNFTKVVELKPNEGLMAQAFWQLATLKQREMNDAVAKLLFSDYYYHHAMADEEHGDSKSALADFGKAIEPPLESMKSSLTHCQ